MSRWIRQLHRLMQTLGFGMTHGPPGKNPSSANRRIFNFLPHIRSLEKTVNQWRKSIAKDSLHMRGGLHSPQSPKCRRCCNFALLNLRQSWYQQLIRPFLIPCSQNRRPLHLTRWLLLTLQKERPTRDRFGWLNSPRASLSISQSHPTRPSCKRFVKLSLRLTLGSSAKISIRDFQIGPMTISRQRLLTSFHRPSCQESTCTPTGNSLQKDLKPPMLSIRSCARFQQMRAQVLEKSGVGCIFVRDYIAKGDKADDITPRFWEVTKQFKDESVKATGGLKGFAGLMISKRGIAARAWTSDSATLRRALLPLDDRLSELNLSIVPRVIRESTGWQSSISPQEIVRATHHALSAAPVPSRCFRSNGVTCWTLAFEKSHCNPLSLLSSMTSCMRSFLPLLVSESSQKPRMELANQRNRLPSKNLNLFKPKLSSSMTEFRCWKRNLPILNADRILLSKRSPMALIKYKINWDRFSMQSMDVQRSPPLGQHLHRSFRRLPD